MKDKKAFTFKLSNGSIVNKYGKNIEVFEDGVLFLEDKVFIPRKDIVEIEERNIGEVNKLK